MMKQKKQTLVEIADEISEATSWINGAKEELESFKGKNLTIEVKQRRSSSFSCHYIEPCDLGEGVEEQISDHIKTCIRTAIKKKQNYRSNLVRKMRRRK